MFLNKVFEQDMLEKTRLSRPNSLWVVEVVSNITFFFINKLKEHPIGCRINLPYFTRLNALQKITRMENCIQIICVYFGVLLLIPIALYKI